MRVSVLVFSGLRSVSWFIGTLRGRLPRRLNAGFARNEGHRGSEMAGIWVRVGVFKFALGRPCLSGNLD